jgi:hypothetical protein
MTAARRGEGPWRYVPAALLLVLVASFSFPALLSPPPAPTQPPPPPAPADAPPAAGATVPSASTQRTPARTAPTQACERCHAELELLRQQTSNLTRARALLVPEHVVAGSAHSGMGCAECHTGFARFPHDVQAGRTTPCVSCHGAADTLWRHSMHAAADEPVTCVQCHGGHDIRTTSELQSPAGAHAANMPCASCHQSSTIDAHRPHADSVSCASCHAPHDTRAVDDPQSWLAPARQPQTCGTCHDSVAVRWRTDIHGDTALRAVHLAGREPLAGVVVCTSCHTGHRMVAKADPAFMLTSVEQCSSCHEKAASTFYKSYHGRATALGSRVSATCANCHGAHTVLPDSFPASHAAVGNLVETCGACHANARPAFVKYDNHPDPFNRARNPWLFWSFMLMNSLLVFVLLVFGTHTLLWWLRLWLDKRRGIVHGIGVHQGAGHGHGHGHGQFAGQQGSVPDGGD